MTTLLRIDASARTAGSYSRTLADRFEALWREANPGGHIIRRDLVVAPPPHLTGMDIDVFFGRTAERASASDELIAELQAATHLLVSTPVYNFEIPSSLKAYLDQVMRIGHTFEICEGAYRGLLKSLKATIVVTCGGTEPPGCDWASGYLRRALAFMGIRKIDTISLAGTAAIAHAQDRASTALAEIDALFSCVDQRKWEGVFTDEDRAQINELRLRQADAILQGDAEAYAALCSDDVALLIPGHPLVRGRSHLLEVERQVLQNGSFQSFRKLPERIAREGDIAVETGYQFVATANSSLRHGVAAARQKYAHVFRKSPEGWRIALLMSNDCNTL